MSVRGAVAMWGRRTRLLPYPGSFSSFRPSVCTCWNPGDKSNALGFHRYRHQYGHRHGTAAASTMAAWASITAVSGLVSFMEGNKEDNTNTTTEGKKTQPKENDTRNEGANNWAISAATIIRLRHFLASEEFRKCVVDTFRKHEDPQKPGHLREDQLVPVLEDIHHTLFQTICKEILNQEPGKLQAKRMLRETRFSKQELEEWKQQANLHKQDEFYFTDVEFLARNVVFTTVIVYQIIEYSNQYVLDDLKPLFGTIVLFCLGAAGYLIYRKRRPPVPPPLSRSTREKLKSISKSGS